jgi:hypothetical protein
MHAPDAGGSPSENPLDTIPSVLEKLGKPIDLILCPGDLADKADGAGFHFAWSALHSLATRLGAAHVVATVGNHDVISRPTGSTAADDPLLHAKTVLPTFPVADEVLANEFFARSFTILERDDWRVVLLNSSMAHGNYEDENLRGRVRPEVLDWLARDLEKRDPKKANILLCHHHPHVHMELGLGEDDVMRGGQLLLDRIVSSQRGPWLVVHGHKHHPKLTYAGGTGSSPTVLAAGSATVRLYAELASRTPNEIHYINLAIAKSDALQLRGTVQSWEWRDGEGWRLPPSSRDLPALCGFGTRESVVKLAASVNAFVAGRALCKWQDVLVALPQLSFTVPGDHRDLERLLRLNHGLRLTYFDEQPYELGQER